VPFADLSIGAARGWGLTATQLLCSYAAHSGTGRASRRPSKGWLRTARSAGELRLDRGCGPLPHLGDSDRQAAGIAELRVSISVEGKPYYPKELRQMNKVVLLWVVAVAVLAFGASATATTQRTSQTYALSAAHVLENGATTILRYVQQHI
jgi:hypothetical protein